MGTFEATGNEGFSAVMAMTAIAATCVAALCLIALHFLSPEFQPSWRMVSEYANGRHGGILTVMFAAWAIGSWALAVAIAPLWATWLGRIGLILLILAGVGEMMAAFFDINHRLHGASAMIGTPSLAAGAVLLTVALRRAGVELPMWTGHLPWIGFVAMGVGIALFMAALSRAGIVMSADGPPLDRLPGGVTTFAGWANRFLCATYFLWVILAGVAVLRGSQAAPAAL